MLIDTHSHIQFKAFDSIRDQVINKAAKAGVEKIIAVGTNIETSKKAIEIANQYEQVFASVGIHPHHVFGIMNYESGIMEELEKLITQTKVVAIGETGIDRHLYKKTKYKNYQITDSFIKLQKEFFAGQIKLAIKYNKSLIIHNREAIEETLEVLEKNWDKKLSDHSVFHFCEPDIRLLNFALTNEIYIGVDADVLSDIDKQKFVKLIPLELLVLETDSPFISPEPKDLRKILEYISRLKNISTQELEIITQKNSLSLFKL